MNADKTVANHYTSGDLLDRLFQFLRDDGADPDNLTLEDLTPYDQFHGRGVETTAEIAELLDLSQNDHLLDIGSGIGGPARYFADRFGCSVAGIDLTTEFCEAARHLTEKLGMSDRVSFEEADALDMPFEAGSFDGAYSMNVSMNIEDTAGLYGEIHRVLKPGGWLLLSELALGPDGIEPDYPTPWAQSAATSFLTTPSDTEAGLQAAGFSIVSARDKTAESSAFGVKLKEMSERGEKSPVRAVPLIHGEGAPEITANMGRAINSGHILPIEILCRKAGE